jgi:hypothetical protein
MRLLSLTVTLLLPLIAARSQSQQPIQVYLHPAPTQQALQAAPTLTSAQAKAVLAHHLGEQIADFDEVPQDEGMWGHLMHMWGMEKESGKPRVVVIDGGVSSQGLFLAI